MEEEIGVKEAGGDEEEEELGEHQKRRILHLSNNNNNGCTESYRPSNLTNVDAWKQVTFSKRVWFVGYFNLLLWVFPQPLSRCAAAPVDRQAARQVSPAFLVDLGVDLICLSFIILTFTLLRANGFHCRWDKAMTKMLEYLSDCADQEEKRR